MRKFLLIIFAASIVKISYADQLQWISKEQAEQTLQYFDDNRITQVVLWCACCDDDPKTLVDITNIFYRPASDSHYYEVYIEGTNPLTGKIISKAVDLAYVHVKRGIKWRCLGKELKFECDPCTKSFKFSL